MAIYDTPVRSVKKRDQKTVPTLECPVCGAVEAVPTYSLEGMRFDLVTCAECGLGSLYPRPKPEEIPDFYPEDYYGETGEKFVPLVEAMIRKVTAFQARKMTRGLPHRAKILDVGCGRGVLLKAFVDQGFEGHGLEISEMAAVGADPRIQLHFAPTLMEAGLQEGTFDQLVLWHVLEHLLYPRETIEEAYRLLKPGGRLIVSVPNFSSWQARWAKEAWFHLDLPRHLFHFSRSGLLQLLELSDFDVLKEEHFSLRMNPFGWVQSWLNRFKGADRNRLYSLLQTRGGIENSSLSRPEIWKQKSAYYLGMPVALGLSLLAAACHAGASITVYAEKPLD